MAVLIHQVDVDAMAGALWVTPQRICEAFERRHYSDELVDAIAHGDHDDTLLVLHMTASTLQVRDAALRRLGEQYPKAP